MPSNERLVELALEAIDAVFSDTSVPVDVAINNLHSIIDAIDVNIEALKSDL